MFEIGFFVLIGAMLLREAMHLYQIQKLLDRAMSRSYHEYQVAENYKPREPQPKMDDFPEDLSALQDIG